MRRVVMALALCLLGGQVSGREVLVVDGKGQPLMDAVVMLTPAAGSAPAAPVSAVIEQVNRRFIPLVTVVPVGSQVAFPNRDSIRHHVYSFSPAKKFDIKLYVGDPPAPVRFDTPGVVVLGCNIHDWMLAFVVVTDAPHFGKTGEDGRVQLPGVSAGSYRAQLWHPSLAERRLEQSLTVPAEGSLRLVLSAEGAMP
ncbi:MAG: methylamine utilization protein [Moraxellaceae bacterium]